MTTGMLILVPLDIPIAASRRSSQGYWRRFWQKARRKTPNSSTAFRRNGKALWRCRRGFVSDESLVAQVVRHTTCLRLSLQMGR